MARSATTRTNTPAQRLRYSFHKIMTGSDLSRRRMPVMSAESEEPGPTVWLTAAAHGDEVGGVVVIQEVFKRLRKHPLLCGSVMSFPLMNPLGFDLGRRQVMISQEDLNRCYPGDADGSLAQRMAKHIFDSIIETKPDAVLDLHNDWIRSIPYVVVDPPDDLVKRSVQKRIEKLAAQTDLLMVAEPTPIEGTLSRALSRQGIPGLTLELGESFVVNEPNVRMGVEVVWRVLAGQGLVEPSAMDDFPDDQPPMPGESRGRILTYSSRPFASVGGIVRFHAQPGEVVRANQVLARIYNAFGKHRETIRARGDAVVLGYADTSIAYPGAPIMAFAMLK